MKQSIRSPKLWLARMARQPQAGVVLLALAALVWTAGCAGKGKAAAKTAAPAPSGKPGEPPQTVRYRVIADFTPFYRTGPQQINGPDLSLKKGTDVYMVRRSFGYSSVKTIDTGMPGFVSTEDLAPLTAQELAALATPSPVLASAPVQTTSGKKSRAVVGEYTLPPGAGAPDSLPQAENTPTPPPNNLFRY